MSKVSLPPCGMYLGVPVYLDRGDYVFQTTGAFYTSWVSEEHDPEWYLEKCVEDNQGNLVVLWDGHASRDQLKALGSLMALEDIGVKVPDPDWENGKYLIPEDWPEIEKYRADRYGAGFYKFVKQAKEKGLYCYSIYTNANPQWVEKITAEPNFLGYNLGEAFSFSLDPRNPITTHEKALAYTLKDASDSFAASVVNYLKPRREAGWKQFFVTSGSFHLDAEIAAGGNSIIPHMEGYAFANLNFGMAHCRGLYKQCDLPLWGCYLAHEHYSYLPYSCPQRQQTLDAGYYLAYMNGSKISVQECGSWWQQSDHVPDTPMHKVPKWDAGPIHINRPHDYRHLVPEARKHYPALGYDSAACRAYRKSVSDFYEYIKKNGTPEGQPDVTFAALKGRYDFCGAVYSPNAAVANAFSVAERNPFWFEGQPERGWDIFRKVIFPLNSSFGPYVNRQFSGTPYGLCDIPSLMCELKSEFLIRNYKSVMMVGWNTAEESDYELYKDYVRAGGTLFLSLPHLAKNLTRDYISWPVENLIHGGDFTELCGVRVKGRGQRFYWSLFRPGCELPIPDPAKIATKNGIHYTHMGDIEITDDVDIWAVEDEEFHPFLLRHKYGKGEVLFLNSWEYPGALNRNDAPGAFTTEFGLTGLIYRYMALKGRGDVYITDDGCLPLEQCNDITFSHFSSNGKTYLQNCNFMKERTFFLHRGGAQEKITLKPHEFLVL